VENQISRLESDRNQLNRQRNDAASELPTLRRRAEDLARQRDELQRTERDLERRIANHQGGPGQGPWTCCSVDRGWEEHRSGHCSTNENKQAAQEAAQQSCLAVHAACDQRRCEQPDSPELERLRRQLETTRAELRDVESRLSYAQSQVDTQERDIRNYDSRLSQTDRDISSKQSEHSQLRSSRIDAQSRISSEERNLSRAEDDVRTAQNQVDRHTGILDSARREWQREEDEAQVAYRYLQQVIANYNAALGRVLAQAEQEATQHSSREAQERAPSVADSMGQRDAKAAGEEKGSAEGSSRDFARGYKTGRESASTSQRLAQSYSEGLKLGQDSADQKAQKEDFPLGYNQAWDQLLANAPENDAVVDITSQISPNPGDNGADLDPRKRAIGNVPSPAFQFPQEPAYGLPMAGNPTFSTPGADFRYRAYPCSGLQLPEFEPKCRERYDATYTRKFVDQYSAVFRNSYTIAFNGSVKSHYDAALGRSYDGSKSRGEEQGAKDQGILDGFGSSLPQARARQFQLGQAAVTNSLSTGHLLIVRDVKLVEESGDGLFASGDRAKLRVVIDNYGLKSSPLGKARVRITGNTNGESLTFELRDLPSLAANTRTTLEGVVAAKISQAKALSKIVLEGVIELRGADGAYSELERIAPEAEIRFPLEIQAITLSKNPRVDEEVPAKIKLTNNTKDVIATKELFLSSDPATVSFIKSPLTTPEINPGESVDLDVNVKPGVWVSDDIPVNVLGTTQGINGVSSSTQIFPQTIKLERNAVLSLKDRNGQPVPSGALDAVAGQVLSFKVQFNFLANSRQPGPFSVRYTQSSDPGIRPANNSTTGVNYGSWSPGTRAEPITFSFNIPESLRGKSGYVMIQLNDGSRATHALQVAIRVP
jgi:septal ring factor EnvC (AmiA/AmiB activator)